MTREEQKRVREANKNLKECIRTCTKSCGFQKINGFVYKFKADFLYVVNLSIPPVDAGTELRVYLYYKPWLLDDLFWEIFEIKEGPKQPKSFHVQGAFTAPLVSVETYKESITDIEDMEILYRKVLKDLAQKIDNHHQKVRDIAMFQKDIEGQEYQLLNYILVEIYQKNYQNACVLLEKAISEGKSGGFASSDGKNIYQYALEYCQGV